MALMNDWKPLTCVTKSSIFDVAGILITPLNVTSQIIMEEYLRIMLVVRIDYYQLELKLVLEVIGVKLFFRLLRKLIDTMWRVW